MTIDGLYLIGLCLDTCCVYVLNVVLTEKMATSCDQCLFAWHASFEPQSCLFFS